ncbi:fimbrial protein [Leptothrix sp. BB-4]
MQIIPIHTRYKMNFTRKNAKSAVAALALIAAAGGANAASLTFSGKVSAATCTITVSNSGTITLPTIVATDLGTDGATAGDTQFTISGATCSGGATTATVYFDALGNASLTSAGGRLSSGVAGVELELLQGSNIVDISKNTSAQNVTGATITSNAFTSSFKVRYKRNQTAAITATGAISVSLNYIISYA